MEYDSALKKNEISSFVTTGISLERTMLNEIKSDKDKHIGFHLCVESNKQNQNKRNRNRLLDTENQLMVARWEESCRAE